MNYKKLFFLVAAACITTHVLCVEDTAAPTVDSVNRAKAIRWLARNIPLNIDQAAIVVDSFARGQKERYVSFCKMQKADLMGECRNCLGSSIIDNL